MPAFMFQSFMHGFGHDATSVIRSAAAFFVVLGVLVCVHELGHYLAARWRGVQVDVFSIGFGRALVTWRDKVGTLWKVGWLPLGGYVKLHGQEAPEAVSDEVRAGWLPGKTFHDKHVFSRMIVVAAGPIANFALAVVLFTILYVSVGMPVARPQLSDVKAGSPAEHAGLQPGDKIEMIGRRKIATFNDIQAIVSTNPGAVLPFHINRNGKQIDMSVTLSSKGGNGHKIGVLGVGGADMDLIKLGPIEAVENAFGQTGTIISQTLFGLWRMITTQEGTEDLGGPLRIAQLSGQVAQLGLSNLIAFIAALSINLGLVNLFPIPLLDGGHLVFYLIEAVSGRAISLKAQEYAQRFGFLLLGTVFVFATWNDLIRLQVFHWFGRFIGH